MEEAKYQLIQELTETYGRNDVFTTDEVRELFVVHGFLAPFVMVTKKETGKKGALEFTHMPRFYFNFIEDRG